MLVEVFFRLVFTKNRGEYEPAISDATVRLTYAYATPFERWWNDLAMIHHFRFLQDEYLRTLLSIP